MAAELEAASAVRVRGALLQAAHVHPHSFGAASGRPGGDSQSELAAAAVSRRPDAAAAAAAAAAHLDPYSTAAMLYNATGAPGSALYGALAAAAAAQASHRLA